MNTKSTIDPQEVAKFNRLSDQWWDTDGPLKTLHDINPARLQFIMQHVNLAKARVLDIGCGGGILAEAMAKQGAAVTGLDADEDSIKAAKLHADEQGLDVSYVCSPIESYKAKTFNVITCMELLEHVNEPQVVVSHCARLLKRGGILFLSTINRTLKAYLTAIIGAEYLLGILPRQTHEYSKFIKPSELAAMVRHAGMDVIDSKGMDYHPFARQADLGQAVSVNYLFACVKS